MTVEETRLSLDGIESDGNVLANDVRERDLEIFAKQFGVDLKEPAKFFGGSEIAQHEHIRTERRINRDLASRLIERHRVNSHFGDAGGRPH